MLDLTGFQFNNMFTVKLNIWIEAENRDDTVTIKIGMPSYKQLRHLQKADTTDVDSIFSALFGLMENVSAKRSDGTGYHISRETLENMSIDLMIKILRGYIGWVNEIQRKKN